MMTLIAGVLGSRLLFVLLRPAQEDSPFLARVLDPANGGVLLGGLLAGLLSLAVMAWFLERDLLKQADGIALPGAVLAFGGWIGCALQACAYGRRTEPSWLSPPGPDYLGIIEARWPTQTIGALSALVLIAVMLFWLPSGNPGMRAALVGIGLGLSLSAVSALRGDPVNILAGLRVDTWAGLTLTTFGLSCGVASALRSPGRGHD